MAYENMYCKFIIIQVSCAVLASICITLAITLSGLSAPVRVQCDCGGENRQETNRNDGNVSCADPRGAECIGADVTDLPRDCQEVYNRQAGDSLVHHEGIYCISPSGNKPTEARCVLDRPTGTGWTVIHRRVNGSLSFQRTWQEYKQGFGDPRGNVWLGNEHVHQLTNQGTYKLKVVLQDWTNSEREAHYHMFHLGSEDEKYKLTINFTEGSAGDSLTHHNGSKFSTLDWDNDDLVNGECSARSGFGGWWYTDCRHTHSNLNGVYCYAQYCSHSAMDWNTFRNNWSLKYASMLIAPV